MARVVCPCCKTGFESAISREDYTLNCISCGIAFNAAAYLPAEEFEACAQRRPPAGSAFAGDRGTRALGNVIRPVETPPEPRPASPETRTGGLPFLAEEDDPAEAAPPNAASPEAPKGFLEASIVTSRFRAADLQANQATNGNGEAAPAGPRDGSAFLKVSRNGLQPAESEASVEEFSGHARHSAQVRRLEAKKVQLPDRLAAAREVAESVVRASQSAHDLPKPASAPAPAPSPAPRPLAARRPLLEGVFGPFEIEGEIARGGVGAVFRAREIEGDRVVALKVLIEGEDAGELERERFKRECETAKALSVPGMVRIYAVGEVDGKPYMAMELIEGKSLDRLIPEKTLTVHDTLVLMQQVAETVGSLHDAGYVHRDLKPANILLGPYGVPKVTDFGLVKSLDEVTRLTASGLVCGTPAYMAPEQARGDGKAIDPRSDVWALGAVLYETLTGEPPFQADNALRLMLRITKDTPASPRELNPKVPREVAAIVMKCLEKNPEHRYPNARELSLDIKRFLEGQSVEARPPGGITRLVRVSRKHRGALAAVGAGLAAVVFVAVLVKIVLAPQEAEPFARQAALAMKQGRWEDAEVAWRATINLDAKHAEAHLGLGLVLGVKSVEVAKRRVRSPETFRQALEFTARAAKLDERLSARAAAQAARLHMNGGDVEQEMAMLEQAVALDHRNVDYRQRLGLAYWNVGYQKGDAEFYRRALQEFREVLHLQPDYPKTGTYIQTLRERFLVRPAQAAMAGR